MVLQAVKYPTTKKNRLPEVNWSKLRRRGRRLFFSVFFQRIRLPTACFFSNLWCNRGMCRVFCVFWEHKMNERVSRDEELLAGLEQKLQLIKDRTQGVAEGYANGFYLWGEAGTSKSFSVEHTLKRLEKSFKLTNSRLSAKGLFELLRDFPDVTHVLEDIESLFSDKHSFGVLRSALWGQSDRFGRQERNIVWQTAKSREEVIFTGGLILISNCPLDDIPELRAIKTRIPCVHFVVSNEEVAAMMRQIASEGHRHGAFYLSPSDCREVVDAIIERSSRIQRNLDLRLLINTFKDRLQWENGAAETHWLDLLESRIRERILPPKGRRAMRAEEELAVARRIADLPTQKPGKGRQAEARRACTVGWARFLRDTSKSPRVDDKRFQLLAGPLIAFTSAR
jgi:hypothetical protein